jgi:hypothetical protein
VEERVLKGDLAHGSPLPRLAGDEERFVLLASRGQKLTPVVNAERGVSRLT